MSVGSRIKERRESLGLTQVQLAELLGVTKGAVGNYETDANSPKASILYQVFRVLKCDANYLFQDEIRERREYTASPWEMENLIKKYRALDSDGKSAVDAVLRCEYQRSRKAAEPERLVCLYYARGMADGVELRPDCAGLERRAVRWNDLTKHADFCVVAEGESMEPEFSPGDLILLQNAASLREGELGLFLLNGRGYLRRQTKNQLLPLNDRCAELEGGTPVCVGRVLGKLMPDWIVDTVLP